MLAQSNISNKMFDFYCQFKNFNSPHSWTSKRSLLNITIKKKRKDSETAVNIVSFMNVRYHLNLDRYSPREHLVCKVNLLFSVHVSLLSTHQASCLGM